MSDDTGNWPKWLTGTLNVVSGALQIAAGAVLGATVGWTGVGAVAATVLMVNGAATVGQGIGQIINDVTNTNTFAEENILRTGAEEVGQMVGGETGAEVGGALYDTTVLAASLYVPSTSTVQVLQQAGKIPVRVDITKVLNNPLDEFVTCGPAQGVITNYCKTILHSGYGKIYATSLPNGFYQLANGHHRVAALRSLGKTTINIFLTK